MSANDIWESQKLKAWLPPRSLCPADAIVVLQDPVRLGDRYWNTAQQNFCPVTPGMLGKPGNGLQKVIRRRDFLALH